MIHISRWHRWATNLSSVVHWLLLETHNWLVFKPELLVPKTLMFSARQLFYHLQLEGNHGLFYEPWSEIKGGGAFRAGSTRDDLRPMAVTINVQFLSGSTLLLSPKFNMNSSQQCWFHKARCCFSVSSSCISPCWLELPGPSLGEGLNALTVWKAKMLWWVLVHLGSLLMN